MTLFQQAQIHAQSGQFTKMLNLCEQLEKTHSHSPNILLDMGVLLLNFGFISRAKTCFKRVQVLAPDALPAQINLANIARELGEQTESQYLYLDVQVFRFFAARFLEKSSSSSVL